MDKKVQEIKDVHFIQEKLDEVNKLIAPYQLAYVSPTEDCVPLEKNAHYMEKQTLDRLDSECGGRRFPLPTAVCYETA